MEVYQVRTRSGVVCVVPEELSYKESKAEHFRRPACHAPRPNASVPGGKRDQAAKEAHEATARSMEVNPIRVLQSLSILFVIIKFTPNMETM